MKSIDLGDSVKIKANGKSGQVVGVHQRLHSNDIYLVRYVDNAGRLADDWLHAEEFDVVAD